LGLKHFYYMNKNKLKTILLLGTHGQKNLGDDLLLETFLRGLSQNVKTPLKFIINSYDVSEIIEKYASSFFIDVFHTTKEMYRLPFLVFKSDVVIFAGGSILKELFDSTLRRRSSSLLMVFGVVCIVKLMGKPIILSHIGVSNLEHRFPRFIAGSILRLVNKISFRDNDSLELSKSIYRNVGLKSTTVPDIVFALPRINGNDFIRRITTGYNKRIIRIGLNLNATIEDKNRWSDFVSEIELLFKKLNEKIKFEIICIPFQIGFLKNNDSEVLKNLANKLSKQLIPVKIVSPTSFDEAYNILNNLDVFIVERFHGIILSLLTDTPFFTLIYDPKSLSLVTSLNTLKSSTYIYKKLDVGNISSSIISLINSESRVDMQIVEKITKDAFDSVVSLSNYVDSI